MVRLTRSMGALTYPLYLVHANLGYIAMSYVIDDGNKWAVYPATLAVALLLAYGVNQLEGARWWSRFFDSTIGRGTRWLDPRQDEISPRASSDVRSEFTSA